MEYGREIEHTARISDEVMDNALTAIPQQQWSKYLDVASGKYYYYNHESTSSTWDKPIGIELTLTSAVLPNTPQPADTEKATRSEFIRLILDQKREIKSQRDKEEADAEFAAKKKVWMDALNIAAASANDMSLSWVAFGYVDPCVYEYRELFGKQLVTLRLIGIALTTLPDEIGYKLRSLSVLNLSNNHLSTLSDSVVQLTNLKELHLTNNKLLKLPERIGQMGNSLTRLEIANNMLDRLPATLASLTRLERIDAECNKISILPENLDAMRSCKVLNFNHNALTRLPRCIGRMKALVSLSVSWNRISYIPEELCLSQSLKYIRLNLNCISHIPEKIGLLTQLHELCLDSNRLTGLPISFYMLSSLRVLRIEENPHMMSPSTEILAYGAEGVVKWCQERFAENERFRMRYIVQMTIDLLQQIQERGIANPAYFESNVLLEKDAWYALQLDYLWDKIIPELEQTWHRELMQGKGSNGSDREVFSFSFTKADVYWAFTNYTDAYGPLMIKQKADFKRCECVDSTGRRAPCVPPRLGYMCTRMCTLLKSTIVLQSDKQRRNWVEYQRRSLHDAVKIAEHEATKYLTSSAGELWLTMESYHKAEDMMNERLAEETVEKRLKLIEKKKRRITFVYDKRLRSINVVREAKLAQAMQIVEGYREELKLARPGYMSKRILGKIEQIFNEIADMPETAEIHRLNEECLSKCEEIEELLMNDYDDSDDDAHGNNKGGEKSEKLLRVYTPSRGQRHLNEAFKEEFDKFKSAALNVAAAGVELEKKMEKSMRVAKDIAEIRVRKLHFIVKGEFAEIQKEMKCEMYTQYLNHVVATAKRKAEDSFKNINLIRSAFQGRDAAYAFNDWKEWVRLKKRRARRDLRHECRRGVREFEAAMESIQIIDGALLDWEEHEDLFTMKPYWRNVKTEQISLDKPGYEHYLPCTFQVPMPPEPLPPGVDINSSSDESDDDERKTRRKKSKKVTIKVEEKSDEDDQQGFSSPERVGITIDGEIRVSDGEDDASDAATERDDLFGSPFTTQNLHRGGMNETFASSASMPTVTTAQSGVFGSAYSFAASFRKMHSFQQRSFKGIIEEETCEASTSPPDVFHFMYGPDLLRAQKGLPFKKGMILEEMGDGSEEEETVVEPYVIEMRKQIEAAKAFMSTKEYLHNSALKGGTLVVGATPTALVLAEINEASKVGGMTELGEAERTVLKIRNAPSDIRKATYLKQLVRKPLSHDEIKKSRERKEIEEGTLLNLPVAEDLLHFAGGDQRMTWVKGEQGMRLRTVLAHRALHVESQLHAEAAKKGLIAPKKNDWITREIAPLFKDGLSSSDEEDEDDEARERRLEKKKLDQKNLMLAKRRDEERRSMEKLRLIRLKEKMAR